MASAIAGAVFSVVGKALAPLSDPVLEAWAASRDLGPNVEALKTELLCVKAVLEPSLGSEIQNSALEELLRKLQDLAYGAEDVLDELDYFRIQDDLHGTFDTVDRHPKGCAQNLLHNARHTAKAVGRRIWLPSCKSAATPAARPRARGTAISLSPDTDHGDGGEVNGCVSKLISAPRCSIRAVGKCLPCSFQPPVHDDEDDNDHSDDEREKEIAKLEFNRVDASKRISIILEQIRPLREKIEKICMVLGALGSNSSRVTKIKQSHRPVTTSESIEPKLYGRDILMNSVTSDITQGKYLANKLTVLPIVGPGGIGKTTFTQHVYQQVRSHFQLSIWICVSLNFNANRLAQEALKMIPGVNGEKENCSDQERIEQRLKNKHFLLVLDDMWTCHEEEWKTLLAPFRKGEEKGNMIIVTTRLPDIAEMVKTVDYAIQLECLGTEDFMYFFEACVFDGHQQRKWEDQELLEVGMKIVDKLKGNPLAAKTVGRLLRNLLTLEHWTRVLESKEWELKTSDYDIMPALKVSYDYLPFHLQQCFSYCALFPEDYEFGNDELIHLWMELDILHSPGRNKRTEDIGQSYLIDLVNNGFFIKNDKDDGNSCYVLHDLLHDLAVKVSSYECITIPSSKVRSIQIPTSVRHLSIIIDDKEVENRENFDNFKKELRELDKRLNTENLRTLMIFGIHHGSFAMIFGHLFRNAKALRAIYLSEASYIVKDVLNNLSELVHLRYLRIKSKYMEDKCLLSSLSRLYHIEVIDLQEWKGCSGSVRDINNLVKLRHFLVSEDNLQLHSDIVEVGKLKLLQELRSFEVGKESKGFELSQLEQLSELGGSLAFGNLERTQTVKEASEAKLIHKSRLRKLALEWDVNRLNKDPAHESNILEAMKPHVNLQVICIRGHGGTNCPKWLGENLSVKNLESLGLDDVPWVNLPPFGELWMINENGEEHLGCVPHNRFLNLRRLELNKLPRLKKWAESDPCHMFSHLEVLIITHCSELTELSFSHSTCCQQQKEAKINLFPRLRELNIEDCPKLLSFPPVPWTRAPCSAKIQGVGSDLEKLVCKENYKSEYSLKIKMKGALVSELWNVLAFDNLTELKELAMGTCPPLPLHHFQVLSSLKTLKLYGGSSIVFPLVEGDSHAESQSPVECITVTRWGASAKELTQLLTYFPKLSELNIWTCEKITGLAVVEKQETQTLVLAPSGSRVDGDAEIEKHQDGTRGEEEIAASSAEGLLLLPSQLQELGIEGCPDLSLQSSLVDHNREAGRTGGGRGLQGLCSLRWLRIDDCPRFLSSDSSSSSSSCFPFPTSLEELSLYGAVGMVQLPLSNLTSLTDLTIWGCGDLRGEGLLHLLAQGRLTRLTVRKTPNFFASPEPLLPHEEEFPSSSPKLQELGTDDVAGVLAPPICTLLSSSLTKLRFEEDGEVERFTKEQEDALQLLTSVEEIRFWWCDKLQCLPAGLRGLPNLKRLSIFCCPAIRSLPKDGLPSSLQELGICDCPAIQSLPKDCLPSSLQELEIGDCPAIQSLPKDCLPTSLQTLKIWRCPAIWSLPNDSLPSSLQKLKIKDCPNIRSLPKVNDLPSSLRELDVRNSESEELRRQCRKLIGIIPVVYA